MSSSKDALRRVELTTASEIRSERVRWLERDRYPLRGLVILAGEKGLGKSTLTNAYLPARVTLGALDGDLRGVPADVLVATAEDDWASVVKPRLIAHGADLDRVHRVRVLDDAGQAMLTLPEDVALIEAQLDLLGSQRRRVAMIVIDPIGAFLSGQLDSHKDAHVRRALAPLASLAERRDLAVIVVAHVTKDESARLIARVNGSGASNWGPYAPSLAMRIESRSVTVDDGSAADIGHLVVTGEVDIAVEDLQGGVDQSRPDTEEEVALALSGGPRPSREVKKEVATKLGCALKTVERAATRMGDRGELAKDATGFPRTTIWTLLGGDDPGQTGGTTPGALTVPTEDTGTGKGIGPHGGASGDGRDDAQRGRSTNAREASRSHPGHREERLPRFNGDASPSADRTTKRGCASHPGRPVPGCRYCRSAIDGAAR